MEEQDYKYSRKVHAKEIQLHNNILGSVVEVYQFNRVTELPEKCIKR